MNMQRQEYATPRGAIAYWISRASDSSSPWLVFLPGLSADHHLFDRQLEHFTKVCSCFVWDAPAHGLSRPFALTFSMQDLAQNLHDIFEREHITAPVLIGQSLGGYIAQVYMQMYPDSARAFAGHRDAQLPQPAHFSRSSVSWARICWDSGLAHQLHLRLKPLKKTVVRMPGPSCRENFWMLKMCPIIAHLKTT